MCNETAIFAEKTLHISRERILLAESNLLTKWILVVEMTPPKRALSMLGGVSSKSISSSR